jgi:hypothetical protein
VSLTESLIGVSLLHMAMQWLVFQFYVSIRGGTRFFYLPKMVFGTSWF